MKLFAIVSLFVSLSAFAGCQNQTAQTEGNKNSSLTKTSLVTNKTVEASCGECQFGMEGKSCDLAVRFDGQSYFVDGAKMDDHGDAHGDEGMCNCIRQAKISGEVKDGRFVATSFELLPQEKKEGTVDDSAHDKTHDHGDKDHDHDDDSHDK